jgi:hypothetical protein
MSFLFIDSHIPIPSLPVELLFISSITLWMVISSSALVKRLKKGRFAKAEDEIIIQSVIEGIKRSSLGKRGIGFWEFISKKLPNRSPDCINNRWRNVLSIDKNVIVLLQEINNKKKKSELLLWLADNQLSFTMSYNSRFISYPVV